MNSGHYPKGEGIESADAWLAPLKTQKVKLSQYECFQNLSAVLYKYSC